MFELDAWIDPETVPNGEFDDLFNDFIPDHDTEMTFAQFNHPYSWGNKPRKKRRLDVGNFGEKLYTTTANFVEAADTVELMSIICTVKGGHISGTHAKSRIRRPEGSSTVRSTTRSFSSARSTPSWPPDPIAAVSLPIRTFRNVGPLAGPYGPNS